MSKKHSKKKKSVKPSGPRQFAYMSDCHGVPAIKPELKASSDYREAGATNDAGLGKWRCSECKKRCTVKRKKAQEEPTA